MVKHIIIIRITLLKHRITEQSKTKMSFSSFVTQCDEPCVCCQLDYDNFDGIAAHEGITMSRLESHYIPIEDKKRIYFYNNTMTTYNVILVKTISENLPQYSPAIWLQVSTIQQPVPVFLFKPGEYMLIRTVKKSGFF